MFTEATPVFVVFEGRGFQLRLSEMFKVLLTDHTHPPISLPPSAA